MRSSASWPELQRLKGIASHYAPSVKSTDVEKAHRRRSVMGKVALSLEATAITISALDRATANRLLTMDDAADEQLSTLEAWEFLADVPMEVNK